MGVGEKRNKERGGKNKARESKNRGRQNRKHRVIERDRKT